MIFQDPMTCLNPLYTIGNQLMEPLKIHRKLSAREARKRAAEMLELVGISSPERRLRQYPHEFSGGMRQRTMIAMAMCCDPQLLIADEPTTALDVTIQAQILDLMCYSNGLHAGCYHVRRFSDGVRQYRRYFLSACASIHNWFAAIGSQRRRTDQGAAYANPRQPP